MGFLKILSKVENYEISVMLVFRKMSFYLYNVVLDCWVVVVESSLSLQIDFSE